MRLDEWELLNNFTDDAADLAKSSANKISTNGMQKKKTTANSVSGSLIV